MRLLFINDLGFQYGAGTAQLRQIQSMLLLGWDVAGVCWNAGPEVSLPVVPNGASGKWYGFQECHAAHCSYGFSDFEIICWLLKTAEQFKPDVVIVGNIHAANWPIQLLSSIRDAGYPVVAFMHDCYFATGRCAYPGECLKHQYGCDETCPTANEYPTLPLDKISSAWQRRQEIFGSLNGIPLAANSDWTLSIAKSSFTEKGVRAKKVYYGVDEKLFSPYNKKLARRILGIPEGKPVILYGAVNLYDSRKGGEIFRKIIRQLSSQALILSFGANSESLPGVISVDLQRDYRVMPFLFNAADLFVGTSRQEAFGQTFCEAAACSVPSVAFAVGGIPEIARHNQNAILIDELSDDLLLEAIINLLRDPELCEHLGATGRKIVETEFTLQHQADRWAAYLDDLGYIP